LRAKNARKLEEKRLSILLWQRSFQIISTLINRSSENKPNLLQFKNNFKDPRDEINQRISHLIKVIILQLIKDIIFSLKLLKLQKYNLQLRKLCLYHLSSNVDTNLVIANACKSKFS
jgi:hypothetical protein